MCDAIVQELKLKKNYLGNDQVKTIYFGGGTPSVFNSYQLSKILETIFAEFRVVETLEITLEANPDDLSINYLNSLKSTPVNRLSIGVQTFDPDRLLFLNRNHTEQEAINCIQNALNLGFENITADLIMGIPPENKEYWEKDLKKMVDLKLPHLSIYGLTIEEKTVFGNWQKKGKLVTSSEDMMAGQFEYTMDFLGTHGYEHYEVSNYALPTFESKHNSSYWEGDNYLGVGPGAHSFNQHSRSFNVLNNAKYLKSIAQGVVPSTVEVLTISQRMNEYVLTRMRTKKGLDTVKFFALFNRDLKKDWEQELAIMKEANWLTVQDLRIAPTPKGFLMADEMALRLFYDEE